MKRLPLRSHYSLHCLHLSRLSGTVCGCGLRGLSGLDSLSKTVVIGESVPLHHGLQHIDVRGDIQRVRLKELIQLLLIPFCQILQNP